MIHPVSTFTALVRGFIRKCPQCGEGGMFEGYLTPKSQCETCNLDFKSLKSDDGPAYITMGLVCVFLVPFFFIFQARYEPPLGMALIISIPVTIGVILGLLPLVKGAFMAALWKSRD